MPNLWIDHDFRKVKCDPLTGRRLQAEVQLRRKATERRGLARLGGHFFMLKVGSGIGVFRRGSRGYHIERTRCDV